MQRLWRTGLGLSAITTLTGTGIVLYSICPDNPSRAMMTAGANAIAVGTIVLVAALLGSWLTRPSRSTRRSMAPEGAPPAQFLTVPRRRRLQVLIWRSAAASALITVLTGGVLVLWNYCPPTSSTSLENLGINLIPIGVICLAVTALGTWLTR